MGKSFKTVLFIPGSVKKQLGYGFCGLLDPDPDFCLDPDKLNTDPKDCLKVEVKVAAEDAVARGAQQEL